MKASQIAWWIGLGCCVIGATIGQAEMIGEPWRHVASMLFIGGTAGTGYMLKNKRECPHCKGEL